METSIHPQFSSYYLGTIICSWTKGEKHPLNWNHRINGGPKEPESLGQLFHLLFNTANRLSNTLQSNTWEVNIFECTAIIWHLKTYNSFKVK